MTRRKGKAPGDNEVGYGKPPRETQFKPGQSGNPRGRPRRALGPQQRMLEAMDQPTREMFMAEMQRPITISSNGKTSTMPTIQMITRAMAKTAAEGGQQAQRTAIFLQLELEREAAELKAKVFSQTMALKQVFLDIFARHRAMGLPEPDVLPHPDDIVIDELTQRVEIRPPWTQEQKNFLDKLVAERTKYEQGFANMRAEAKEKPRDWMVPMLAVMAQRKFDLLNDHLPERYRVQLKGRLNAAQIEDAEQRARKGLAAQDRRRARAGEHRRARDAGSP